jgi:very-short-patch-repair endonuclease
VLASTGKPQFETSGKLTRANAKRMRREPTDAERRLWRCLREHVVVSASHFRRQVPLGPYIADFCCLGSRLIVEVDGEQHGSDVGLQRDAKRDAYLAAEGFRILRFSNRDVMTSMSSVLDTIHASLSPLNDKDASPLTPNPSPQGGGGQARGPEF